MSILVIGSFMMDLVVRTDRAPAAGETLIGESFGRFPGGKGANQAVAAARLGGEVTMAGKVGNDLFGDEFFAVLAENGVGTKHILRDDAASTGVGSIVVEKSGQNRIIVVPGANLNFTQEETDELEDVIRQADLLMMQLEMDMSVVERAAAIAAKHRVPVILNPAPAAALSDQLLGNVTYLTPNETELALLSGMKVESIDDAKLAALSLLDRGVHNVVVTLAEKGALLCTPNGFQHVEGFPVEPVDTVAAGDSFNGALAVQLVNGVTLAEAVRFANAVGALTVTKQGAIPSLPRLEEVNSFMQMRLGSN
ncbi:ribokinase [Paenibacillus thermotolerans]|uniref:ribokinase n=1 Tax=Paenibacillus thermotolerans TaxID=3027807 RepID=UPI002367D3E2|nr:MULTISPECIES: ribokinase [unclassified Paenibacillus]